MVRIMAEARLPRLADKLFGDEVENSAGDKVKVHLRTQKVKVVDSIHKKKGHKDEK